MCIVTLRPQRLMLQQRGGGGGGGGDGDADADADADADGDGDDNGGELDDHTLIETMKKLQVICDL